MNAIIEELLLLARLRAQDGDRVPLDMAPIVRRSQARPMPVIARCGAKVTMTSSWPRALGYHARSDRDGCSRWTGAAAIALSSVDPYPPSMLRCAHVLRCVWIGLPWVLLVGACTPRPAPAKLQEQTSTARDQAAPEILDLDAYDGLACAIRADHRVWCWGTEQLHAKLREILSHVCATRDVLGGAAEGQRPVSQTGH